MPLRAVTEPPKGLLSATCSQETGATPALPLRPRQLDEAFELPDAGGVAHFPEGLGLDLADALAGDLELAGE